MPVWDSHALIWLLAEALLPILGAAALFLLLGLSLFLAADRTARFKYAWKEALDPMGWLYGASILAIQSGTMASSSGRVLLAAFLYGCAGVCLILVLGAMTHRGGNPAWVPKRSFHAVAIVFTVTILALGYAAHAPAPSKATRAPAVHEEAK